jgi:hypothetical protein
MHSVTKLLAAAAAIGGLSAPLAAQAPYGYPQQSYPQQGYPGYQQQAYGYGQQGYAQNPVGQIIDQLLGNRYNVSDRQAVSQCANAAMIQAQSQYSGGYNQGYGGGGYNRGGAMRVTSITDVQRRNSGLRVTGTMSSGYGGQYAGQQGYQNRDYGNVSFRCNVDYRGAVTNVRIGRNGYRG